MNKFWNVFATLFWIAFFVGYAINTVWDFTHPGREPHWMHNPWWNAPAGVAFFLLMCGAYLLDRQERRQYGREADARAKAMASSREADLPEMKLSDWDHL
jgi:hypothetical protein